MRYRLRTLLIALVLGPPLLAGAWFAYRALAVEPSLAIDVDPAPISVDLSELAEKGLPANWPERP